MKKYPLWKSVLMLLLALSLCGGAAAEANTGLMAVCDDMGYSLTADMLDAIRQAVPSQPVNTPLLTLRSVDVAYDGVQLVVSANILPKEEDVQLISFAVTPDDMVEGTGQTYREQAAAAGKRLLTVECVPTCLEEEGVYFLESYPEEDGSISIVTGGSLEKESPLTFGYHLRLYNMDEEGDLLNEVVGGITVQPLIPLETAVYRFPKEAGISSLSLTRTFFGVLMEEDGLQLLDALEQPVTELVLGDKVYYHMEALPSQLKVMKAGKVWTGERE